jgi:hypothetical protein
MLHLSVPEDVFNFFAADPVGPMGTILTADEIESPIFLSLDRFLKSIPSDIVADTRRNKEFLFFWEKAVDVDRMARIWVAERFLSDEIARRRLFLLRNENSCTRPAPYSEPALADLAVDEEGLVPLSSFTFDGSRLIRNGYAFTVFCTTASPNSTYWLINALRNAESSNDISVRLDPFLFGPEQGFPAMFYKMWLYGRPLDWERISRIREPEHGRWLPEYGSDHRQFTDFCWDPRDREIHFLCEELPKGSRVECEAARYLHAVYIPSTSDTVHLDGALRLYTVDELENRTSLHIRNCGKRGLRKKIFRTYSPISRNRLSEIAQAFYVWNEDVRGYFYHPLASPDNFRGRTT